MELTKRKRKSQTKNYLQNNPELQGRKGLRKLKRHPMLKRKQI